jgi:peptidoglycan/LPS O-acetylase OafA/YrhL
MLRWSIQFTAGSYDPYYYNTLSHLDAILTGIAAALLLFQKRATLERLLQKWGGLFFILPAAFYVYLILFVPKIQENDASIVFHFSFIAVASAMFLLAVLFWPPASRFFSQAWLVRFGQLTYGTYMFHLLGIMLASKFCLLFFKNSPLLMAWLALAVTGLFFTWLLSFASWHFLEKRFYKKRYQFARVPSGFGAQKAPVS